METTLSITGSIARFGSDPSLVPTESARAVARLSLMDWAAAALAGLDEPVARITRELADEEAGAAQATLFGLARKVPARMAALANGALSHALDYDDTHFAYVGHPSVAILPAALAVAERQGASAAAFLDAALIGMEAACRIGHWLGTQHYNHGFHQTATSGCFGATVAAGRLMGLDTAAMRQALGIATTRASGLKSQFGTMGKPFNAGIAAANGVEAALLAARGFVSRPDGLECLQGFGETHAGERTDLAGALAGLGNDFWFEQVQHKFHACCHGLHAGLEALAALKAAHHLQPGSIAGVTITINPRWLRVCNIASPTTGLEAKFSYRLTTAMALAGVETAALQTYSDAICSRPDLMALRDRVVVRGDASLPDTAARVALQHTDGRALDGAFDLDQPMPLSQRRERIAAKVRSLLAPQAAEAILALDSGLGRLGAIQVAETLGRLALSHPCAAVMSPASSDRSSHASA
ncbi:MAG TPA: MmgE/PrpD family protein [Beijerinckiaceae bacterium]|nr:MmgE/PrpD family protein [Beijerinckiaceae bacterium]